MATPVIPTFFNMGAVILKGIIVPFAAIVSVCVGGFFAFLLIKRGMGWGSTALGSTPSTGQADDSIDYNSSPKADESIKYKRRYYRRRRYHRRSSFWKD